MPILIAIAAILGVYLGVIIVFWACLLLFLPAIFAFAAFFGALHFWAIESQLQDSNVTQAMSLRVIEGRPLWNLQDFEQIIKFPSELLTAAVAVACLTIFLELQPMSTAFYQATRWAPVGWYATVALSLVIAVVTPFIVGNIQQRNLKKILRTRSLARSRRRPLRKQRCYHAFSPPSGN